MGALDGHRKMMQPWENIAEVLVSEKI